MLGTQPTGRANARPMTGSAKQSMVCHKNGLLRRFAPRNDGFDLSRDLRQRSVKRRGGARQILEGKPAVGRLLLRFRRGGTNLGHRLGAIEQGFWCDHMKFMGFDRLML